MQGALQPNMPTILKDRCLPNLSLQSESRLRYRDEELEFSKAARIDYQPTSGIVADGLRTVSSMQKYEPERD